MGISSSDPALIGPSAEQRSEAGDNDDKPFYTRREECLDRRGRAPRNPRNVVGMVVGHVKPER